MITVLRHVALVSILSVEAALLLLGRTWPFGWSILLIASGYAVLRRAPAMPRVIAGLAPYFSVGAALGLLLQIIGVAIYGNLGRSAGFQPHANTAAATTVALWMLVVLSASWQTKRSTKYGLWHALIVLGTLSSMFLLFVAGSRSIILGLIVGLICAVLIRVKHGVEWRAWLAPVIAVAVLFATLLGATYLRPDVRAVFGSFERGPIYMAALDIARLSPLVGLGGDAWINWAPIIEPSLPLTAATHSHSLPLAILIEGGSIGLAAVLVLVSIGLVRLIIHVLRNSDIAANSVLVGTVALSTQALVDLTVLYYSVYVPLVLVAITWNVAAGDHTSSREGTRTQ